MSTKRLMIGAFAVLSLSSVAAAATPTRTVYVGGHEPARLIKVAPAPAAAPYALTGKQAARPHRFEPIRIGSRIAGFFRVSN